MGSKKPQEMPVNYLPSGIIRPTSPPPPRPPDKKINIHITYDEKTKKAKNEL
jgi:hypothetical protein